MNTQEQIIENTIVYNWNISKDFPPSNPDEISRTHLLETIAQMLTEDSPIVFLEGDDGSGSTTLLAQFCKENPFNSFSLFVKPASKFSYSPDYLRFKLFEQIYWFLEGKSFDKDAVDISQYETYLQRLRRNKTAKNFYFVIDGLHQIPMEEQSSIEQIFKEVLPIGAGDGFRFLIAGQKAKLSKFINKLHSKTYQLSNFSIAENEQFFSDVDLSHQEVFEIRKLCQGIPGRLASIKRLIKSGMPLGDILNSDPSKYLEFIKLEFDVINSLSNNQKIIVAVLAFGKRALSDEEILQISLAEANDLKIVKAACHFLRVNEASGGMEFVSELHRRYAEKQLSLLRNDAIELQVKALIKNPGSVNALRFLPSYYQLLNQQQAIVDLISPEHYSKLLESTQSLTVLRSRAELGFKGALALKNVVSVFKFSMHKSFFTAVTNKDGFESEIIALVSLDQSDMALALANSAASKEDRLSLLATYAKKTKEKNGILDPSLASHIKQLAEEIDFVACGDKAVDIATDVLFFDPDLAVSIVENASGDSTDKKVKDQALAHLSIIASINNSSTNRGRVAVDDKAQQKISDEAFQKMTSTVSVLLSNYSIEELKNTIEKMESKHRLYFLKTYINRHQKNPDILEVVEYGLDFMISDTIYVPKSRDLSDLVRPLPYTTNDINKLKKLIARFDSQLGLIQSLSLTKDLVIFHMCIARAEVHYDEQAALNRIEQVYYEISEIKNLETLMECYALLLDSLVQFDSKFKIEEKYQYQAIVKKDLRSTIDEVLKQTANHYVVVKGVLDVLASTDPQNAIELAGHLNTQVRRDKAYRHITRILASTSYTDVRKNCLLAALSEIGNPIKSSKAIINILNVIGLNAEKGLWFDTVNSLEDFIKDPYFKLVFKIKIFELATDINREVSLGDFVDSFNNWIGYIDSKIHILDLYYKAVPAIAKHDINAAKAFYRQARDIKGNLKISTFTTSDIFQMCLSLLFRTMPSVMKNEPAWEEYIFRLERLIEMLPSDSVKASYYNELAVRAWCVGKLDICNFVVKKYCQPLLEKYKRDNEELYKHLVLRMFSAFHCFHSETSFQLLKGINCEDVGAALYETARIRLRKLPSNDPSYRDEVDRFMLSKEDAYDIVRIIQELEIDSDIYAVIDFLVGSMMDKINRQSFTIQQKNDIGQKLIDVINSKLPDGNNIKHIGYVVSSLAKVYQLTDANRSVWDDLLSRVETISNIADRGFVYIQVSLALPSKYDKERKVLLEKALVLFYSIPSITDRLARLETFSRSASTIGGPSVKEVLKTALKLTLELEDSSVATGHQKEIISIADTIDSKFSDELIELIDDDPAREYAKHNIKYSSAQIKAKREFSNVKDINEAYKINKDFLSDAAWTNLGQLLANKLETKNEDVMSEYVAAASGLPLDEAYPVLSWYIENASRRFIQQGDFKEHILPLTEVLLLSTEMAGTIIENSSKSSYDFVSEGSDSDGLILVPKSRDDALQYIRLWLRKNSSESLIFCDPYFGPEDIDLLRLVLSECPTCRLSILTSTQHLLDKKALNSQAFLDAWDAMLEQEPPVTEVIAIDSNGKKVIHDRWLLSNGAGLRMGTSFAALGGNKLSEISEMIPSKVASCGNELSKYLKRERYVSGNRINYTTFNL